MTALTESSPPDPGHYILMTLPMRATALGLTCTDCGEVIITGRFTLVSGLPKMTSHCDRRHSTQQPPLL